MKTNELLELSGDFTWDFGQQFFIETSEGNFVWSDPGYEGDNTIKRFTGTFDDWISDYGKNPSAYGRSKGSHIIKDYCGADIVFKD